MRRLLITIATIALLAYAGLCALLFFRQDTLLYYPQPLAAGAESALVPVPGHAGVVATAHEVHGSDAVVYYGGNAEDVSQSLPDFRNAFPGHALYLLHYRGYGGSTGEPSESVLASDALALFDMAHARHPRVTVIGRSLGSGLAARVASERPAARLVLVTPYDSLVDIGARHYPWMPVRWLMRDRYETWRVVPRITAPTTVILAEHDQVIPKENSDRLLGRFKGKPVASHILPGTDHNSLSEHPDYLPLLAGKR